MSAAEVVGVEDVVVVLVEVPKGPLLQVAAILLQVFVCQALQIEKYLYATKNQFGVEERYRLQSNCSHRCNKPVANSNSLQNWKRYLDRESAESLSSRLLV